MSANQTPQAHPGTLGGSGHGQAGMAMLVAGAIGPLGGIMGWLTNTFFSFLVGLFVGGIIVAIMHVIPRKGGHDDHADAHAVAADGTLVGTGHAAVASDRAVVVNRDPAAFGPPVLGSSQGNSPGELVKRQVEERRG